MSERPLRFFFLASFCLFLLGCAAIPCGFGFFDVDGQCVSDPPIECTPACSATGHEVCRGETPNDAQCVCAPGYAGNPCEWVGAVVDPGFQDGEAWVPSGGANVEAQARNVPDGQGKAVLTPSAVCFAGQVSQQIEMPSYETAEPLVVELSYRAEPVTGVEIGFDQAWRRLPRTDGDGWPEDAEEPQAATRFCLGEAAYGGLVDLQIAPSEKSGTCASSPQDVTEIIEVDRIDIVPATPEDACPAPGEVFNSDAEADLGGWAFEQVGAATAGFDATRGRDGDSGARLYSDRSAFGDDAVMTTRVSVPQPGDAGPALGFWWRGSADALFQTEIGTFISRGTSDRSLGTLAGSGGWERGFYCLPPWTHGSVVDLSFQLGDRMRPEGEPTELVVDDLEIVLDERCSSAPDIFDPGFESAPIDRTGVTFRLTTEQSVRTVNDSTRAHSGDGFLEITYRTTDASVLFETWVLVPEPDLEAGAGPRLTFHTFIDGSEVGEPEVPVTWFVGLEGERDSELRRSGTWELNDKKGCLPPEWAGRWYRFQIWVFDFGGAPDPPFVFDEPKVVRLDDFALDTSPECPAE